MALYRHILTKRPTITDIGASEKDEHLAPRSATVPITQNPPPSVTAADTSTSISPPPTRLANQASPLGTSSPSSSPIFATSASTIVSPAPSAPFTSNPDSKSNSPTPPAAAKKSNVGAMAAGIAAGVIALFLLLALVGRRRRRKARYAAGTILRSSSCLQVGGGSNRSAGVIVPDPFPAIRQFNTGQMTSTDEANGNQADLSEKARIHLEQQMSLYNALSSEWPQPMNAKHGGLQDVIQTPSSLDPSTRPLESRVIPASSSSPLTPALRPASQVSASLPALMATPPPPINNTPRVMGTIQDEDSGVRLMQHSDTGGFVEVLPPSYTVH